MLVLIFEYICQKKLQNMKEKRNEVFDDRREFNEDKKK
jgi:hypothetical protein